MEDEDLQLPKEQRVDNELAASSIASPPQTITTQDDPVIERSNEKKLSEMSHTFNRFLEKLQSLDTRASVQVSLKQGLAELKKIIEKDRSREALHIYLSQLKTSKAATVQAQEAELELLKSIAELFKERLIDSYDKPPSLIKTAIRFVNVVLRYLRNESELIAAACAAALISLQKCCLFKLSDDEVLSVVFTSLKDNLLGNKEKPLQQSASFCLSQLIQFWKTDFKRFVRIIFKDVLLMFQRTTPKFYELHTALIGCLECCGLQQLDPQRLQLLLRKIVTAADENHSQGQIRAYMGKVTLCRLLGLLGELITQNTRKIDRGVILIVVDRLTELTRNRIVHVQDEAKNAIRQWRQSCLQIKQPVPSIESKNIEQDSSSHAPRLLKSLVEARRDFKTSKNAMNVTTGKDSLSIQPKGRSYQSAKHAFVQKGSGIGGGYHSRTLNISPPGKARFRSTTPTSFQRMIQSAKKTSKHQTFEVSPAMDVKVLSRYDVLPDPMINTQNNSKDGTEGIDNQKLPSSRRQDNDEDRKESNAKNNNENDFAIDEEEGDQGAIQDYGIHKNLETIKQDEEKEDSLEEQHISIEKQIGKSIVPKFQAKMIANNSIERNAADSGIQTVKGLPEQHKLPNQRIGAVRPPLKQDSPKQQSGVNKAEIIVLNPKEVNSLLHEKAEQFGNMSSYLGQVLDEDDLKDLSQYVERDSHLKIIDEKRCLEQIRTAKLAKLKTSLVKFTKPKAREAEEHSIRKSGKQPVKVASHDRMNLPKIKESRFEQTIKEEVDKYEVQMNIEEFIRKPWIAQDSHQEKPYSVVDSVSSVTKQDNSSSFDSPVTSKRGNSFDRINPMSTTDKLSLSEWREILVKFNKGNVSQAYHDCLDMNDDLYLLRLLLMGNFAISDLSCEDVKKLWGRFAVIHQSSFVQVAAVGLLDQALKLGLAGNSLSVSEGREVLSELYALSGKTTGSFSYRTAALYNNLQQQLYR